MEWTDAVEKLYTDIGSSTALTFTPKKIKLLLRKKYGIKNVKEKQISDWLSQKFSYSLHKRLKKKFPMNPTIAANIDDQWQGDLLFLKDLGKYNANYEIMLVFIDVVSRYAWVELMKNKSGLATMRAFENILKRSGSRRPKKIQTDKGTEFLNRDFQNMLKREGIVYFNTYSDQKASIAERFIQTLKNYIYRYLDENNTNKYYDKIQDIVNTYNNTMHTSTQYAPSQVNESNLNSVLGNLYGNLWEKDVLKNRKAEFKVGDYVRISVAHHSDVFRKGYRGKWSEELFKISSIKDTYPYITYGLTDLKENSIMGSFYEAELQKVPPPDFKKDYWRIEKIIREKKVGGKKMYLVKWAGYGPEFNKWIPAKEIKSDV